MSKILSELIGGASAQFAQQLQDLERASRNTGIDIKLIGDIAQRRRQALKALRLDPDDSTGPEIYAALLNRVHVDDKRLAEIIGASSMSDMMKKVTKMAAQSKLGKNVWVLKQAAAKELLCHQPPVQLMKHLGFRSVNSMLRRTNIDEIYPLALVYESNVWWRKLFKQFDSLTHSNFEHRDVKIIVLNEKYSELVTGVSFASEIGVIILPSTDNERGYTLHTLLELYHALNVIRFVSTFLKTRAARPDYGQIAGQFLLGEHESATMAGHEVPWRVVHRHLARAEKSLETDPYVYEDDLTWYQAEEALAEIEPAMKFWLGLEYVGAVYNGRPISFNLVDVVKNYVNNTQYSERRSDYLSKALLDEVLLRYMQSKILRRQVI